MNCASFPESVVSSNYKIRFLLRFASTIVCFTISIESYWISSLDGVVGQKNHSELINCSITAQSGYFHGCWFDQALPAVMGVGRGGRGNLAPLDFENFSKKRLFS